MAGALRCLWLSEWERRLPNHSGDKAMYGSDVTHRELLNGKVAAPKAARRLLAELAKYPAHR